MARFLVLGIVILQVSFKCSGVKESCSYRSNQLHIDPFIRHGIQLQVTEMHEYSQLAHGGGFPPDAGSSRSVLQSFGVKEEAEAITHRHRRSMIKLPFSSCWLSKFFLNLSKCAKSIFMIVNGSVLTYRVMCTQIHGYAQIHGSVSFRFKCL